MQQSDTQCALSAHSVCAVVAGVEGRQCVCVCVGCGVSFFTDWRDILNPGVSGALHRLRPVSKTQSTTAPKWWHSAPPFPPNIQSMDKEELGMCCLLMLCVYVSVVTFQVRV